MKVFVKILLVIFYLLVVLWAIGQSIDTLPFHFADFLVALFAFGGIIYWAEFDVEYIFKFIDWLKSKKK